MKSFEKRLQNRGYPTNVLEKHLSEVKFSDRKAPLEQKNRVAPKNIALCNAISLGFAQLKDISKEEMAPHTESTITKRNLYRASAYIAKENP